MVDLKTLLLFTVFSALLFGCGTTISFEDTDKSEIAYEKEPVEISETDYLLVNPKITYADYPSSTKGHIKGKIIDEDNNPVKLASVKLNSTIAHTSSDELGKFSIDEINTGFYHLDIVKGAHYRIRTIIFEVKAGKTAILDSIFYHQKSEKEKRYLIDKPIIYLYPEEVTDVHVELDFAGDVTHTYPKYNSGWNVRAHPDGTLYDNTGKEYYALYWEGDSKNNYTVDEGFVIRGEDTIVFLEKALEQLGLNRKEANEFIIYWLPQMENNPYNLIHFSTTEYEEMAKLNIIPKPDTLIRIMMVFKPLAGAVSIKEQNLSGMNTKRTGFTVVEWGGCRLP